MTRTPIDGISLNVEVVGEGEPFVLLHGFTGSTKTWYPLYGLPGRKIAIDLPGHGESDAPHDPARYRLERTAVDLLRLLDALEIERFHLLGYSLGGRLALHLALAAPSRLRTLIIESASPGIEDPIERAERIRSDEALAQLIERDGIEAFVDHWERLPLFASQARLPVHIRLALRAQRLAGSAKGLAASLRGAGAGQQEPLWSRLSELTMPVLLIAGALDEKYSGIARRTASLLPNGKIFIAPDAGHAVHLEAPDDFKRTVAGFVKAYHGETNPESDRAISRAEVFSRGIRTREKESNGGD